MGMFDSLSVAKSRFSELSKKSLFQTKSFDCTLSHFIIFNDQLWLDSDENETFTTAAPVNYTGIVNIYDSSTENGVTRWVEFNLHIEDGKLTSVEFVKDETTKDSRDISAWRPSLRTPHVSIDLAGSSDSYDHFHSNLDANLDAIRAIIGCKKATISYPQNDKNLLRGKNYGSMVTSVVQDLADFDEVIKNDGFISLKNTDNNGNKFHVFLDEFAAYSSVTKELKKV